jgi:hypothetical protein
MSDALQDKIVSTILDLAKVGLGAVITWISTALAQKNSAKKQFQRTLASILNAQQVRAYGPLLHSLKTFFDERQEVLEKYPANCNFYDDWLLQPTNLLQSGETVWTAERITKLKEATRKLKY